MFSYNCWEDDSINTEPFRGRSGFQALLRFSYHRDNPNHDDQVLYSYQRQYFMLRDDFLSENQEKREVLAIFLVDALISESFAELIVNEIMSLAHSMLNDPDNVDRKVLPIAVDIQIRSEARAIARERTRREFREGFNRRLREESARERSHPDFRDREFADDQMARATRDSMLVKFVPATKSSIEALERVTIFDNNSCLQVEECRICLETLPIGAKDFEECNGIEEVAILIKDKQGGEFEDFIGRAELEKPKATSTITVGKIVRYPSINLPSLSFRNMDAAADAAMFSYNCWEDDSINTEPLGGRYGCRALLRFSYHRDNPNHDDQVLYSYQRHYFMQRDDVLSENQEKREVLAIILVDAGISESVAELIVNEIWSLAHSMLNDPNNVDRKILPIAVDIQIRSEARAIAKERRHREYREEFNRSLREESARERSRPQFRNREFADDQMARATRDSMLVKFVPATKSSIEALERVTIFDNNSCLQVEECRICLETLPIGAKVIRMPCSHIFHGNCIVRWLESSNLCPLCRFAMPH
ncbi:hypothetical protein RHSIM_RhsimUnG0156200 [Rhododendron simsii]|uniref:RING-type E3 ubiquitin transferase n=1 Tax=Rhododendron simsii TaxID=118357 RepID=A0A834L2F4_RHOSS|nr:hypothetical protein RHSIM_RhsimUnG0156200 [Rhododendron simsii]